ncbi:MAG: hypothetical protein IMZ47_09590 [Firmicutes bacterium]|nr:hypothetical protein [Bacillota bacterium]
MKTKILLGSIGAVAILILVSFTNVIGVQSTTSGSISNSPLFNIRTQKAINEGSKDTLTSNYLGKGLNALPFPLRDNRTALIQKFIERIGRMDDKEFNRFQSLVISHFYEEKNNLKIDTTQLVTILKHLKSNTKELKIILNNNGNDSKNDPPTLYSAWCPCLTYDSVPHCFLTVIIMLVIFLLFLPEIILLGLIGQLLTLDNFCYP